MYKSRFIPELDSLKIAAFGSGGKSIVLHRREIVRREGVFERLRDPDLAAEFDVRLLSIFKSLPYLASTVVIDKAKYLELYGEWNRNPYHYCLQALVERYILWMNRHDYIGDVVIEARGKTPDKRVKESFQGVYEQGTENIPPRTVQKRLTSHEIKFMQKADNCPAMQVVDLIAHPSFRSMKLFREGRDIPADFGARVVDILERWKYARHPKTMLKIGWGKKWLPK